MSLVPQQDIVVIEGPYQSPGTATAEAAELLRQTLETYPPCRIISITATGLGLSSRLVAVVETV